MASNIQQPQSAVTVFLDQPPSCLEFCPNAPDYFVAGTYLLSETKDDNGELHQTKTGSLQLWKLDAVSKTLSQIQQIALPYAVFDLHFHPEDPDKFAIASSVGSVALYQVMNTASTDSCPSDPCIEHVWTKQVHDDTSIPALFLAWAPKGWFPRTAADGFAVTFSDSQTTVFGTEHKITNKETISEWGSFAAKQMIEVWFVALAVYPDHPTETETLAGESSDHQMIPAIPFVFTGNDFGSLHTRRFEKHPDIRKPGDGGDEKQDSEQLYPLLLDHDDRARHHTAGVTAILPLPIPLLDDAPILLTGSYDESLRVYHATRRGDVLTEQSLGGGVWRLQLLHTTQCAHETHLEGVMEWRFLVLASCMHAGTRVVCVSWRQRRDGESTWAIETLAEFTEHESMNYASGVWKGPSSILGNQASSELVCVSSSFYDRRVCVWKIEV